MTRSTGAGMGRSGSINYRRRREDTCSRGLLAQVGDRLSGHPQAMLKGPWCLLTTESPEPRAKCSFHRLFILIRRGRAGVRAGGKLGFGSQNITVV